MSHSPINRSLQSLVEQASDLKAESRNCHDTRVKAWRDQVRSWVEQNAPIKLPAFEEIRFASDYLLSKPEAEQKEINDRIALCCDLDLALELLEQARILLEKEEQRAEAARAAGESETVDTTFFTDLGQEVDALDFSSREKEDIFEEIGRLDKTLHSSNPDWDRIKRTVKFLLDFDRTLAIRTIPKILSRLDKS